MCVSPWISVPSTVTPNWFGEGGGKCLCYLGIGLFDFLMDVYGKIFHSSSVNTRVDECANGLKYN